jgi:DNA polymerase I-like protein with 3'-5' exonuclease and polymerase domains
MLKILPPVRKIFLPDPGHIMLDADLVGAEAMYVAWECGGQFKEDFKNGVAIHVATMERFYPDFYKLKPKHEPQYTKCKNMAYGSIYVGSPRGIGSAAGIPAPLVESFQRYFFQRYPGIKEWHHRVETELYTKRTVTNHFGYRIYYFDRPEGLLPEAVNWLPQSSIGTVCQRGAKLLRREFPFLKVGVRKTILRLNVHDSNVFQVPFSKVDYLPKILDRLNKAEELAIPFPGDPLNLSWDMKASRKSWGDCEKINWEKLNEL